MKITFLGAGVFGSALANIVKYNAHETKFYDPIKFPEISLKNAISGADCVVYAAPSEKHQTLLPELDEETPLICASKGFLSLSPFKKFKNFSALGGAAFAEEVEANLRVLTSDTKNSITSNDGATASKNDNHTPSRSPLRPLTFTASSELSERLFSTKNIKVEYSKDTLGIMLCGALKNIYAIGAGLFPQNSMIYLEQIIGEFKEILEVNSANPNTLKLSCGVPDLLLSCSEKSRNFRFGRAIANNLPVEKTATVEGLSVIKSLPSYPDFVIPKTADTFKTIIAEVENATK